MASSILVTVRRQAQELVRPAISTQRQCKLLSDIDDQVPSIFTYPYNRRMEGKDPVRVIREALARTLVFYYPFAGRLREGPSRKLMVDCNDEGVVFIGADADFTLEQFGGDHQKPPIFPCFQELLYDVPGSKGIIDCPLLLVQVLAALIWRLRTIALQLNPDQEVEAIYTVNARSKFSPPLPVGLTRWNMQIDLIVEAKQDITEEHMRSLAVADLMVIKGRPGGTLFGARNFLISNMSRLGFEEADFGWGRPVYGGPVFGFGPMHPAASCYVAYKNKFGEKGILVPICLPDFAMPIFVNQLENLLTNEAELVTQ